MLFNLREYFDNYHNYYIRVRALVAGNFHPWSATHSFGTAYPIEGNLTINLSDMTTCQGEPTQLGSTFICNGEILGTTISGGSGNYQVQWYPRNGMINTNTGNPTVLNPLVSRRYICRVYDVITTELVEAEMFLTVNRQPTIRMTSTVRISEGESYYLGESLLVISDSPEDNQFYWTDLAGWSSTQASPQVRPTRTTRYYLTVTDGNGCVSRQTGIIVYVSRGKEADPENIIANDNGSFMFYPNPTNDYLNLEYSFKGIRNLELRVENIMGQVLFSKKLRASGDNLESIDVSNFASGVYFIRLNLDGKIFSEKFIKE
jgi:hypothetical protein